MRNWSKWGLDFWQSVVRHIGTAGMAWLGTNAVTGVDGKHSLETLPLALLFGAIMPSVFTFLQNSPIPPEEADVPSLNVNVKVTDNENKD